MGDNFGLTQVQIAQQKSQIENGQSTPTSVVSREWVVVFNKRGGNGDEDGKVSCYIGQRNKIFTLYNKQAYEELASFGSKEEAINYTRDPKNRCDGGSISFI